MGVASWDRPASVGPNRISERGTAVAHSGKHGHVSEFTVRGAQAGKPLADLSIPESYRRVPPAVPAGLPFNVAQLYMRMAEGIREGKPVRPDFDVAVKRHQLLDVIQKASDTGIRQIL